MVVDRSNAGQSVLVSCTYFSKYFAPADFISVQGAYQSDKVFVSNSATISG